MSVGRKKPEKVGINHPTLEAGRTRKFMARDSGAGEKSVERVLYIRLHDPVRFKELKELTEQDGDYEKDDETVRMAKKYLDEHPEVAKKYLKHRGELGGGRSSPGGDDLNIGQDVISRFLGKNWDRGRVARILERLKLYGAGMSET